MCKLPRTSPTQFEALADKVSVSAQAGSTELWRDMRQVNPKTKKAFMAASVQSLIGPDGECAHDNNDIRKVFHDHLSATESASDVTRQQVLHDVRLAQDRVRGAFDLDPSIVPTLPQLEQCFRDVQGHRLRRNS